MDQFLNRVVMALFTLGSLLAILGGCLIVVILLELTLYPLVLWLATLKWWECAAVFVATGVVLLAIAFAIDYYRGKV